MLTALWVPIPAYLSGLDLLYPMCILRRQPPNPQLFSLTLALGSPSGELLRLPGPYHFPASLTTFPYEGHGTGQVQSWYLDGQLLLLNPIFLLIQGVRMGLPIRLKDSEDSGCMGNHMEG